MPRFRGRCSPLGAHQGGRDSENRGENGVLTLMVIDSKRVKERGGDVVVFVCFKRHITELDTGAEFYVRESPGIGAEWGRGTSQVEGELGAVNVGRLLPLEVVQIGRGVGVHPIPK